MKHTIGLLLLMISGSICLPNNKLIDEYDYDENDGANDTEDNVEVNENKVKNVHFKEKARDFEVEEGESIKISCDTEEKTEDVLLFKNDKEKIFYVGNKPIDITTKFKVNDNNVVTLDDVKLRDNGTYICLYQNFNAKLVFSILVKYAPTIEAVLPLVNRVTQGDSVTLSCDAKGYPEPVIFWSKKEGNLPSGAKRVDGLSMTLDNVNRHVEGTYMCAAENDVGQSAPASIQVEVEYPPEIITEKEIIHTGEGDKKVELVCIVHSRPKAWVSWFKDNENITLGKNVKEVKGGHRHTLEVENVQEEDYGQYECVAENDLGKTSANITLTDFPMKPRFTSGQSSDGEDTYTLAWETESYYPIVEFMIKYRPVKSYNGAWIEVNENVTAGDSTSTGSLHRMEFELTELEPETEYEAVVQVKNENQWGDEAVHKFSTKKASPTTTSTRPKVVEKKLTEASTSPATKDPAEVDVAESKENETTGEVTGAAVRSLQMNAVLSCVVVAVISILS